MKSKLVKQVSSLCNVQLPVAKEYIDRMTREDYLIEGSDPTQKRGRPRTLYLPNREKVKLARRLGLI